MTSAGDVACAAAMATTVGSSNTVRDCGGEPASPAAAACAPRWLRRAAASSAPTYRLPVQSDGQVESLWGLVVSTAICRSAR